jgi:formylglycine-generating enzyme required for sulfatase activity
MRFRVIPGLIAVIAAALLHGAAANDAARPPAEHSEAVVIGKGVFRDCPDCPEMVVIPAGRVLMGSSEKEPERFDSEGPQHLVSLRWFALGKYDVTVAEFRAFVKETGYEAGACSWPEGTSWQSSGFVPAAPVVCVNWHDAQAYIAWLNTKLRGSSSGTAKTDGPYRLPSEAEWEYAARAGTVTARWWGDSIGIGNANCNGCGSIWDNRQLAPVDSFSPNPFGLYGMLGNVWQWTEDCWNESYVGAPNGGAPWTTGDCGKRVLRGGSWSNLPKFVRSAARNRDDIARRGFDYASYAGFRVAMTLP